MVYQSQNFVSKVKFANKFRFSLLFFWSDIGDTLVPWALVLYSTLSCLLRSCWVQSTRAHLILLKTLFQFVLIWLLQMVLIWKSSFLHQLPSANSRVHILFETWHQFSLDQCVKTVDTPDINDRRTAHWALLQHTCRWLAHTKVPARHEHHDSISMQADNTLAPLSWLYLAYPHFLFLAARNGILLVFCCRRYLVLHHSSQEQFQCKETRIILTKFLASCCLLWHCLEFRDFFLELTDSVFFNVYVFLLCLSCILDAAKLFLQLT